MPSIWKWPCSVLDRTKPTALKLLLDPLNCLCIFGREKGNPLTLQAADQLARWSDMRESKRPNHSLVDDEQHEDDDGGPGEGYFCACI